MNLIELIDRKRQGLSHTQAELTQLINAVNTKTIPDYQLAAWLMAVCCRGLNLDETTWLTQLYVDSGETLDFSDVDGVVADKHSTGGVGDKTTLIVAPLLAACGVKVAKLSGRGLGFTGGTADKLEAIPGFNVHLSAQQLKDQVKRIGIALGAQTADLAPADGIIYALRDVTATVESIPLITASVMSKKIAAGAEVITLDIKVGSGAFMKSVEDARQLANTCRTVGKRLGKNISTVITDMSQPLGNAIGHTNEVAEAITVLKDQGPKDLTQVCLMLAAVTLVDAHLADSVEAAQAQLIAAIQSGKALAVFKTLIEAQGGDSRVLDDPTQMPMPKTKKTIVAKQAGFITHCDALLLAQAAKALGAGRLEKKQTIDLAVGIELNKKLGDPVQVGEILATLWLNEVGENEAEALINQAIQVNQKPETLPSLIVEWQTAP